ncbi:hypothetical protein GCM10010411_76280 [Actinomadura fulvescens]|uniref:Uncharacterized protein n=1 Tax=Actinomadura fulvescens TaxID=46160 RepID=A0ABP6CWJ1_9ACTN
MAERDSRYDRYNELIRSVFGHRADSVLADSAWPALGATLARAEHEGLPVETVLRDAVSQLMDLESARSVPALVTWRIWEDLAATHTWSRHSRAERLHNQSPGHSVPPPDAPPSEAPRSRERSNGRFIEAVRDVLGAHAEKVLADEQRWPRLVATLQRAERDGLPARQALQQAADQLERLDRATSVTALVNWRISKNLDNRERSQGDPPGTRAASRRDGASKGTSPAAESSPTGDETGKPWFLREFGDLTDRELAERIPQSQTDGIAYSRLARQAKESAEADMQAALARNGPGVRAVTAHHETLNARAEAIGQLTALNSSYRDLLDEERAAREEIRGIQAKLGQRKFGLPMFRGHARQRLLARVSDLENTIEQIPGRLVALDARRSALEEAAGPEHRREATYREWLTTEAEWPRPLETARLSDIADANQAREIADQLQHRAEEHSQTHEQLLAEVGLRQTMPAKQAAVEAAERTNDRKFRAERAALQPELNRSEARMQVVTSEAYSAAYAKHWSSSV